MLLRCFAEQRDGAWEALCVDLDLAVQGDSFEQVYRDLADAVAQYIDHVHTLPPAEQRRLLRRKAPVALRLRFVGAALALAFLPRSEQRGRAEFTLPAAA
jgi:hypothetical protein